MKQGYHRFHCTNGHDLIVDTRGTYVRSASELAAKVCRHVLGVRASMPDGLDWSGWIVDVHDASGRHAAFFAFDEDLASDGVPSGSVATGGAVSAQREG